MLNFPFYSLTFWLAMGCVVLGAIGASFGIYLLIKRCYDEKDGFDVLRTWAIALGGIVFFSVGTCLSFVIFRQTYSFRSVEISQVRGLKVIKSAGEYSTNDSEFITIENPASVQEALNTLRNCSESLRSRGSYQDGYKLKILFTDQNLDKDFYISVYRKSSNESLKSVVIPHLYENKNLDLGDYDCPAFQDWVRENIDPHFKDKIVIRNSIEKAE